MKIMTQRKIRNGKTFATDTFILPYFFNLIFQFGALLYFHGKFPLLFVFVRSCVFCSRHASYGRNVFRAAHESSYILSSLKNGFAQHIMKKP
jgi:hypothetical protein